MWVEMQIGMLTNSTWTAVEDTSGQSYQVSIVGIINSPKANYAIGMSKNPDKCNPELTLPTQINLNETFRLANESLLATSKSAESSIEY